MRIAILCAAEHSNYFKLRSKYNLNIYTKERDCRNFQFDCPVITHAPCAQWSKLHAFAHNRPEEKELAYFCFDAVNKCGGIFEHPAGSHFFKTANADFNKIISVNQSWFGYRARKRTYLYYNLTSMASHPLSFDAEQTTMSSGYSTRNRSLTPVAFNEWLIQSILLNPPQ